MRLRGRKWRAVSRLRSRIRSRPYNFPRNGFRDSSPPRDFSDGPSRDSELANLVQMFAPHRAGSPRSPGGGGAGLGNEFSPVRAPSGCEASPSNAHTMFNDALQVFSGRLDGITLKTLSPKIFPHVLRRRGLLRRRDRESHRIMRRRPLNIPLQRESSSLLEAHPYADNASKSVVSDTVPASRRKTRTSCPSTLSTKTWHRSGSAIAARIVADTGGSIHFENNHPVRSCFSLGASRGGIDGPPHCHHNVTDTLLTPRPHLLIVDDEA